MAKSDKLFAQARANIITTRKLAAQARKAGFKYTTDVIGGIYGNLKTTLGGVQAALTSTQKKQLQSLQRVQARTQAITQGQVTQAKERVAARLGSATAGGTSFRAVQGVAAGSTKTQKGLTQAGAILDKGAKAAMSALQEGTAQAQAAAQYATAQALSYRAKEDARLIAEKQLALKQMRLQHALALEQMRLQHALDVKEMRLQSALDLENFKAKQDYLKKLEQTGNTVPGASALATSAAEAFPTLQKLFNTPKEDGTYPTATEVVQMYAQQYGVTSEQETALITALARAMYAAGAGPETPGQLYGPGHPPETRQKLIVDSIMQTIIPLYGLDDKAAAAIRGMLEAKARLAAASPPFGAPGTSPESIARAVLEGRMSPEDAAALLQAQGVVAATPSPTAGAGLPEGHPGHLTPAGARLAARY
jgi:hypothetical protein